MIHGQTFQVWSPSIFDNDEVSQVYGEKKLEISIQDGQELLMMILIGEIAGGMGTTIFYRQQQELSPDMNKIKERIREVNKYTENIR